MSRYADCLPTWSGQAICHCPTGYFAVLEPIFPPIDITELFKVLFSSEIQPNWMHWELDPLLKQDLTYYKEILSLPTEIIICMY